MDRAWNPPARAPSVVLKDLELRHFRNLGVQTLCFPPEGVALIGDNAQGKTNLLEAVYYLECFRSFRGAGDAELTAFSENAFHVKGVLEGERSVTVAAGFDRAGKAKKVSVDGKEASRFSVALGRLGAMIFSPADVDLVRAGPARRRQFLDVVLSLNRDGYVKAIQSYRKALAQRNAALRTGASSQAARAWDGALVEHGARVTCLRAEWATAWAEPFSSYYAAIAGNGRAALAYNADAMGAGAEDALAAEAASAGEARVAEAYRRRLAESWASDLRRQRTTAGPHRDDLLVTMDASGRRVPVRTFGSGGQCRTAALALRLVEAATIRRQRGIEPILLLDDAFAELDEGRSQRVVALVEDESVGQVVLTAPSESDVRLRKPSLASWRIRDGAIEA